MAAAKVLRPPRKEKWVQRQRQRRQHPPERVNVPEESKSRISTSTSVYTHVHHESYECSRVAVVLRTGTTLNTVAGSGLND